MIWRCLSRARARDTFPSLPCAETCSLSKYRQESRIVRRDIRNGTRVSNPPVTCSLSKHRQESRIVRRYWQERIVRRDIRSCQGVRETCSLSKYRQESRIVRRDIRSGQRVSNLSPPALSHTLLR